MEGGDHASARLAALALLEALATNSAAFRRGCGAGSGSASACLARAVFSAAEAARGPPDEGSPRRGRGRRPFSKKRSQSMRGGKHGGSGRVPRAARLVLQSFQARALQATSRGAAEPFYEAFVAARPTARAWAAAAGASVPEEEAPAPRPERAALGGPANSLEGWAPSPPPGPSAPVSGGDAEDGEGCPEEVAGLPGGVRAQTGRTGAAKTLASEEGDTEAPSRSSSEEPGEVEALCGYLRALSTGGGSPRAAARWKLAGAAGGSSAARLRKLLAERESIRGALGRLEGVLHALRSIESRAGAAKWAASAGALSLRDEPSPRRGALAAACLKSI